MNKLEEIYFAAGCFWGVEKDFQKVLGVKKTYVGYTGGHTQNPSYESVCTGSTGHAEAIQIFFDLKEISFEELLEVFWSIHDSTTKNQQGLDIGEQYRSAIFYKTQFQKEKALQSKDKQQQKLSKPITTEITEATEFYPAEEKHQKYFEKQVGSCLR